MNLSSTIKAYAVTSFKLTIGWGIIIILILFFAFFVLSLIGFILSNISDKREKKEKNFEDIYKLKKLLDEGIITKEEFDEKKKTINSLKRRTYKINRLTNLLNLFNFK